MLNDERDYPEPRIFKPERFLKNGRLPEHSDIASLPYLSALVKEVYRYAATCSFLKNSFLYANRVPAASRWEPVGPLGSPCFFVTL